MAGPGITGSAEGSIGIRDDYLDAHTADDTIIDCFKLVPAAAFYNVQLPKNGRHATFQVRGVKCSSEVNDRDGSAVSAVIIRRLKDDPAFLSEPYAFNIQHAQCIRHIRTRGTTARGIILYQ